MPLSQIQERHAAGDIEGGSPTILSGLGSDMDPLDSISTTPSLLSDLGEGGLQDTVAKGGYA